MANFKLHDKKFKDVEASIENIMEHLTELKMNFLCYLAEKPNFASRIEQAYLAEVQENDQFTDELMDLQENSAAKPIFDANQLTYFWL